MLTQYTATITTNGSGAATVYLGDQVRGRIICFKYAPGTIDTGADLTITGETSAVAILTKADAGTATVWYYPLAIANQVSDGAASAISEVPVWVYVEKIKVVVAQGGDTKTGTITVWVEEPTYG